MENNLYSVWKTFYEKENKIKTKVLFYYELFVIKSKTCKSLIYRSLGIHFNILYCPFETSIFIKNNKRNVRKQVNESPWKTDVNITQNNYLNSRYKTQDYKTLLRHHFTNGPTSIGSMYKRWLFRSV